MYENVAKLYPTPETSAKVMDYSIAHSTTLPEYLVKYHKWGCEETKMPDFLISTYQAQMLIFLARVVGAKKGTWIPSSLRDAVQPSNSTTNRPLTVVLELGVYIGFSAMVWSEAVGPDGHVVGLELSEEYASMARKGFADNKISNVDIKLGDGVDSLAALEPAEPFDLVFLDANKEAYPKYLELILAKSAPGSPNRLLRPGGLIVADNVLKRGIVADASHANPHYSRDVQLHGEEKSQGAVQPIRRFNDALVAEARLESFLMPLFDGLGMARLRD